jgi:hypothetical protein
LTDDCVLHPDRHQQLPDVSLRVFGRMHKQAQDGRRQVGTADTAVLGQGFVSGVPELMESMIHLLMKGSQQICDRKTRIHLSLCVKRLRLFIGQRLAPGVRTESVENACEMLQVESDGSDAGWSRPQPVLRKVFHQRVDFLSRLQ